MKTDIKTILHGFFGKKHGKSLKNQKHSSDVFSHSYRDWQILIAIFSLITIGAVFLTLSFFRNTNSNDTYMSQQSTSTVSTVLNIKQLDLLNTAFQARIREHSNGVSASPVIVDPSL